MVQEGALEASSVSKMKKVAGMTAHPCALFNETSTEAWYALGTSRSVMDRLLMRLSDRRWVAGIVRFG